MNKSIILVVLLCWASLVLCVGQLCPPSNVQNVNYVSCSCIWWVPRLLIMRRRGCWGLRCNAFSSSSARPLLLLLLILLRCNAFNSSSTRPCQAVIRYTGAVPHIRSRYTDTVPDQICGTVPLYHYTTDHISQSTLTTPWQKYIKVCRVVIKKALEGSLLHVDILFPSKK